MNEMNVLEELGIPKKYLKPTVRDDRYIAVVHRSWLKSLVKYSKLAEFTEKPKFESFPSAAEDLGQSWTKVFVTVHKKHEAKVIPLPRHRSPSIKDEPPLLFAQLLQYIANTNYKNLWKEAYKKYNSRSEHGKESQVILTDYNDVLRETITRTYGCKIINVFDTPENSKNFDVHTNVLPAACGVETLNAIFLIHVPFIEHNLNDCVMFSPAILDKCYSKPLFVIYQLLNTLKSLHDRSLTMGDITLNDIYLRDDLWLMIFPRLSSNLYVRDVLKKDLNSKKCGGDCLKNEHKFENFRCINCGIKTYDKIQITNENLEKLCQLWIEGGISNFTYLTALNNLSGRKYGDPNCHHVFPWVTDFSSRCGKNWRDLKKSKYRLNKGDRHLDLMYEEGSHHVSDVLSAITYYAYTARRAPKAALRRHVRAAWVPAEYPGSVRRLQEWTPDECAPEFYAEPAVFRSVHDDLDDLEVPAWAAGPEDFVERHRELLEGAHVSERLHHWIDLTFGYKLSGQAAIKAKNVCLQLVDDHSHLTNSGIVQLFTQPHPPRNLNNLFWGKMPPKIYIKKSAKYKTRDHSLSSVTVETEKSEDDLDDETASSQLSNWPTLGFSRFLSRSRSSLNEDQKEQKMSRSPSGQRSTSLGPKNPTFMSHVAPKTKPNQLSVPSSSLNTGIIYLPKEYNPAQLLMSLESKHGFYQKTFYSDEMKRIQTRTKDSTDKCESVSSESNCEDMIQNGFTNRIFTEAFEGKKRKFDNQTNDSKSGNNLTKVMIPNYNEIISGRRTKELQTLGCLIVEIFMAKQIRTLKSANLNRRGTYENFSERLKTCVVVLRSNPGEIPVCIKYITELLLQPESINFEDFKYPAVTEIGLPPPSAHLYLEPLLNQVIPFTPRYLVLYNLLKNLKDFENVSQELNILYYFDCDGFLCGEYENLERTKVLFEQNIGECKVKACAKTLEVLLTNLNTSKEIEIIYILVPYVKSMIEDPPTSVLAAWYLFDPIAKVLGPQKSSEIFLDSVLKLYENEPSETTIPYNSKIAKLYHHTFLLRLIVRFGLKRFLDNFVTSLVEAVGRYRDYEKVDFILHTHEKVTKKTSHLKTIDTEELSPNEDLSESEKNNIPNKNRKEVVEKEPEVFEFESEEPQEPLKSLIEHLELNVATSDLPLADEAYEAIQEEPTGIASPSIPIPSTSRHFETVPCEVGSRKSLESENFDVESSEPGASYDSSKFGNCSTKRSDLKISDVSSDSLVWLSHRLGPVLTARYLSRNLLKMLTLCYVGRENLMGSGKIDGYDGIEVNVANSSVVGDRNASKVLDCLGSIAALYGEQLILLQYFPHMSELIALCKRKLSANLEGGLVSCLSLLKHVIPYLSDSTLMEHLDDDILKGILHPAVRLLGSTKYTFPNGSISRGALARKFIDALYILSMRMGAENTRTKLAVPALQRFFLIFEKIKEDGYFNAIRKRNNNIQSNNFLDTLEETYIEVRRDGSFTEWSVSGSPAKFVQKVRENDSSDSISPPVESTKSHNETIDQAMEELRTVFTSELAHTAYVPFLKQIGLESLEISLKNHPTVHALCQRHLEDQKLQSSASAPNLAQPDCLASAFSVTPRTTSVALIGNRIDFQHSEDSGSTFAFRNSDIIGNTSRHLRGNWLAYWEHEIGRPDKDARFNFKQIKLQTFSGHTHLVKSICVLDNENSFLSGGRDKAVKLWSLRSQGEGSAVCNCQWTYTSHRKSVLAIGFVETSRLIVSCDGTVHVWDPFVGQLVGLLENPRSPPVNTIRVLPVPSTQIYAATTEGVVRVIDVRTCSYTHDLKVNVNQGNLIRCIAVSKSGTWFAAGQSSGHVTVLDCRTGRVLATWRAHESEVLQLITPDDDTLVSSSLDQNVSVWRVQDGKFKFSMKGTTEPVHCLNLYNSELITGTTANRIGVYTSVEADASFSSTKLRTDAFKGLLSSMAVLPLNRLLLLGSDNGNITLVC